MILALDIGATNTRIGLVKGKTAFKIKKIKTSKKKEEINRNILELINSYKNYDCICVGIAGIVKSGKIVYTPNMNFSGVDLKKLLGKKYAVPIYVDNDAKCAALAELKYGMGKKNNNFFHITLGTGIGGAQIINRQIKSKEVGHFLINGKEFEDIASGTAAHKIARRYHLNNYTNEKIFELANKGNKLSLELYKKVGNNLADGLIEINKRFNSKKFVFSGGFSKVNYVIKAASAALRARYKNKKIILTRTKLGDKIGLIGASLLPKLK